MDFISEIDQDISIQIDGNVETIYLKKGSRLTILEPNVVISNSTMAERQKKLSLVIVLLVMLLIGADHFLKTVFHFVHPMSYERPMNTSVR